MLWRKSTRSLACSPSLAAHSQCPLQLAASTLHCSNKRITFMKQTASRDVSDSRESVRLPVPAHCLHVKAVFAQREHVLRPSIKCSWLPTQDVDILRSHPGSGGRPGPPRFSMVVYSRGFLFLAGQIVDDTSAPGMDTYYGQAKQVLHQVGQLLEESGSSMERILQASCLQTPPPAA